MQKGVLCAMTKGRDMAADSLGDILEAARLKQRSGMLRVECSLEGRLEEGEVYLSTGQPIYARAGRLVGIDALNYLISWRNIHFAFVTDVLRPPMNIFTATRQSSVTTPLNWRPSNITPPHLPVTG